jgi:signal transduction histidine kinase
VEDPAERVLREGQVVGLANFTVLIARNGTEALIDDSAAPIRDANGELLGTVLVFRDVTNERRTQEAMRRAERLAAAGRLSATMAHEINNPLQAVAGLVYLSRTMPGLPNTVEQQLSLAEGELQRIAHIVQQVLGFYRESQTADFVDVPALMESVLALYSNKLRSKDIRIERKFGDCPWVKAASGELKQVISNLVANAADAVRNQGTIAIRLESIEEAGRTMLHIQIEDDGPGIPPEHKQHLFEPFFTTKRDVGTGLGLWLTKEIVERHGGRIEVVDRTDRGPGAAFSVLLPAGSDLAGVADSDSDLKALQPAGPGSRIDGENSMQKGE